MGGSHDFSSGKTRERDRIAIEFTRHPVALIRALERLHAGRSEVGRVTRATPL
jgi:hypothetical protein